MKSLQIMTVLLCLFRALPAHAAAVPPLILHDTPGSVPLGAHLAFLEDTGKQWDVRQVASPPLSGQFQSDPSGRYNFGLTASAYWVRFTVLNAAAHRTNWILAGDFPAMEHFDLYIPDGRGRFLHKQGGTARQRAAGNAEQAGLVMNLHLEPGHEQVFYARFESRNTMLLSLSLWEPSSFAGHQARVRTILGIGVGIVLILVVNNLLLFLSIRDRSYLYFVLFLLTFGLNQASLIGLTSQYLWPGTPWLAIYSLPVFGALSQVFGLLFTRSFLATRKHAPGADKAILWVMTLALCAAGSAFLDYRVGNLLVNMTVAPTFAVVILATVRAWRTGYGPARVFMLAWACFICGGFLFILALTGFLELNLLTQYGFFAGFCLGGVLLSWGLGDRLRVLEKGILKESVERARAEQEMREAEEKLRAIFEESPDAVLVIDQEEGRILRCNEPTRWILGYGQEALVGKPLSALSPGTPLSFTRNDLRSLNARGALFKSRNILRADGSVCPMDVAATVIPWTRGLAILATLRDVTERKNAEEELRRHREQLEELVAARTAALQRSNTKLQEEIHKRSRMEEELIKVEKLESLGVLAGGIAHDFNNTLAGILTNISVARLYGDVDDEIHQSLEDAEKASFRARGLTRQLLTFARGGLPVRKPVSLEPLLRESVEFALSGSNVRHELSVPGDLRYAEVDEGQIGQVLHNIVINADQAMPRGGVVRVCADNITVDGKDPLPVQPGPFVRVSISDEGCGIPKKALSSIFDPFYTTKQKGSGLGLSTSFSIIKKHNGHIRVETEAEKGTTFHIYLPALEGEAAVARDTVSETLMPGQGRILLVDDEPYIRRAMGHLLKRVGYDMAYARDGQEGIDLYKRARAEGKPFDLVIMDLTIPGGMGGREAVRKLREIDPEAKVIAASGYTNAPAMSRYREYGFMGVVVKPFRSEELCETVHQVLQRRPS